MRASGFGYFGLAGKEEVGRRQATGNCAIVRHGAAAACIDIAGVPARQEQISNRFAKAEERGVPC
jgi:hypothetical protein